MFGEIAATHKVRQPLFYGEDVLTSTYTISAATGSWVDTGLHLSLPSAGTYLINGHARVEIGVSGSGLYGLIELCLYRSDIIDYVAFSQVIAILINSGESRQISIGFSKIVIVNSACYIALYALRDGSASAGDFASSNIISDGAGYTLLNYVKIG